MTRLPLLLLAFGALAVAWSGLWHVVLPGPFAAHMAMHVTVMALAAPLLAFALAGGALDPTVVRPALAAPVLAMVTELIVVWGWHVPLLHRAARAGGMALAAEQASFLAVGLLLWLSVFGGAAAGRRERRGAGIVALLMTSMHMTLLGTLIALAPRPLYGHGHGAGTLGDQQVAGIVMLLGAATSYVAGGAWLVRWLLAEPPPEREARDAPLP